MNLPRVDTCMHRGVHQVILRSPGKLSWVYDIEAARYWADRYEAGGDVGLAAELRKAAERAVALNRAS